jgi:hypothetical protein
VINDYILEGEIKFEGVRIGVGTEIEDILRIDAQAVEFGIVRSAVVTTR